MGAGFSHVFPCFNPDSAPARPDSDLIFNANASLDETLGHSFCYVRSSARFISPTHSDRFLSPTQSLHFDDSAAHPRPPRPPASSETGFRAISGAAVSANSSTPITVLQLDDNCNDAVDAAGCNVHCGGASSSKGFCAGLPRGCNNVMLDGFESTSSFCALPLQRLPRGGGGVEPPSGPLERAFFMSGPIERGALSGPLDPAAGIDNNGGSGVPFSAPLGGMYPKKRRKRKVISGIRKALYRNFSVVPVRNFIGGGGGKDVLAKDESRRETEDVGYETNVQWALGKAGEDRVHVVVSEELGWLFVGIYDGFNGPDGPEFLMNHLYKAMYNELEGLFWDTTDHVVPSLNADITEKNSYSCLNSGNLQEIKESKGDEMDPSVKNVTNEGEQVEVKRRRLWEFLVEDDPEDGLDLSGSARFAFTVDDALCMNDAGSESNRSLFLSKLKHGILNKHKDKKSKRFSSRFWLEGKQKEAEEIKENNIEGDGSIEGKSVSRNDRKRKVEIVDHELVLSAMSRALELTEQAYLDLTDKVLDRCPELALMGSCLLVVLMRDEDVYVMNVGDSRAIVAHYDLEEVRSAAVPLGNEGSGYNSKAIVEESANVCEMGSNAVNAAAHTDQCMKLIALQLSTDHSTSIQEEVTRIKNEHPDDSNCIVNDRVKGRLKVTRAFGAGFLKQHKWNDAVLEMFRNEYIGTAPYISCSPSLRHHRLTPRDQFLVLSSDGLYQYFSNLEVVSHVRKFMERNPDGDPAQHLIEELLFRAAQKAGMDFHELLDIPQGDRRKYHDDVTVMVVSLEGRIWKSSGKYL